MLEINQRDVYLLPYPFGASAGEDHLHIVLSTNESNSNEGTFLAVMITSSTKYRDELSFALTDGMFEKPLQKLGSHVRMHLIMLALNDEIRGRIGSPLNKMKQPYFNQMMKTIGEMVFNFDFTPL